MALLGLLCIGFAIIDFAGMFLGYDLSGVGWSPIVAGTIGGWLVNMGSEGDEDGG